MKPQQYIVCYKDTKTKPLKVYGPFVSDRLAAEFADELPTPLEGGTKGYKPTSTFTGHEANLAALEIMSERQSL